MSGHIAGSIMGVPGKPGNRQQPSLLTYVLVRAILLSQFSIFSAAFQCCGDEQWGDWRPHLAVILSNQGGDPELYQRTIVTMGDTLGKQRPAPSPPLLYFQASFNHPVLRFSGSVLGPSLCLRLSFDPGASVFWGQKLQGEGCPSCLSVSQFSAVSQCRPGP